MKTKIAVLTLIAITAGIFAFTTRTRNVGPSDFRDAPAGVDLNTAIPVIEKDKGNIPIPVRETRTETLTGISFVARSFFPAADSRSERSSQVKDRARSSVIGKAKTICEGKGGILVSHSRPDTESIASPVYHIYSATIESAVCEIDLRKEAFLQQQSAEQLALFRESQRQQQAAERERVVESAKRNAEAAKAWLAHATDANSVCDYVAALPHAVGYISECRKTADASKLSRAGARISMAAALGNYAVAASMIQATDGKEFTPALEDLLVFITRENYAFGEEAVQATSGKVYSDLEISRCAEQAKHNYAYGGQCLTDSGKLKDAGVVGGR